MRSLYLNKFELIFKSKKKFFNIARCKNILFSRKISKIIFLIMWALLPIFSQKQILSELRNIKFKSKQDNKYENIQLEKTYKKEVIWQKIKSIEVQNNKIKWNKYEDKIINDYPKKENFKNKGTSLNSLNRSIIYNHKIVGPDISWNVPLGFGWNKKYRFDFNARGHNTAIPDPPSRKFFGWNNGDAVGLLSYQFLHSNDKSFGINFGVRSLYQGNQAVGGDSFIGEGLSAGFRWDYAITKTSGIAIGAEQLIHFDKLTDTGRNIYLTVSKGFWNSEYEGQGFYPLDVATAGIGTGRLAVGTVRGFCSDTFGGSGTEKVYRRLCWSPIFSLARIWNPKVSTFFEYNSRFFLLGGSVAPKENIPIRGTLALIISDHIDNYKLHDFSELNWVFNISFGF